MIDEEKKNVVRFIILMGMVSLFADMVYETARGVMGPYLGYLGANAFAIGIIFGLGEFLGYLLRIVAGVIVDKTRKYWSFVFIGYGAIVSIPLLAFADYWLVAGTLIIIERIGKALRSPAKDTLLSIYSKGIGKGLTFGIHETADQVGAVIGPLVFYIFLVLGLGYKNSFLMLFIPFALMVIILLVAKSFVSKIQVDVSKEHLEGKGDKKITVYLYLIFIFLTSLGFVGFPIFGFHAVNTKILPEVVVPLVYSLVMVLDAIVAIPIGLLYDKFGVKVLSFIPVLILIVVFMGFSQSVVMFAVGMAIWGIVMSAYETVIRAYIGDKVSIVERGKFYGIFNTVLGLSLALGNAFVGYIYEKSVFFIILFVIIVELLSMLVLGLVLFLNRRR